MDRQHRHDLKHDKFVDEIGVLSLKAKANQRLLLAIALGAVAIALLGYGIYFYRSNQEQRAQLALATAIETFEAPVGELPAGQPATAGPRFKTEPERTTAAEKQFKDVKSSYSGTDAGDVAGLYLARLAVNKGDTKSARPLLEEFLSDHSDHLLAGSAHFSLYQLRIESGEAAQVSTQLEAELKKPEPEIPGDSLLILLAQAYEVQGDSEKARDAYRRITTTFPESPYAVEAQRRVGA